MSDSSGFSAVAPPGVEPGRSEDPRILNPNLQAKGAGSPRKTGRYGSPPDGSSREGREIPSKSPWRDAHGYRARYETDERGKTRTIYEHREVMAQKLGRPLRSDEHVHHIDGDRSNNDPTNLELLTPSEHAKRHASEPEMLELACLLCGAAFLRMAKDERGNRRKGRAGPYCGKRCAGRASRARQLAAGQRNLRAATGTIGLGGLDDEREAVGS